MIFVLNVVNIFRFPLKGICSYFKGLKKISNYKNYIIIIYITITPPPPLPLTNVILCKLILYYF